MGASRVVEVDHIELRLYLVALRIIHQMVICDGRKVGVLEIVDVLTKSLFNLLLDKIVYNGV